MNNFVSRNIENTIDEGVKLLNRYYFEKSLFNLSTDLWEIYIVLNRVKVLCLKKHINYEKSILYSLKEASSLLIKFKEKSNFNEYDELNNFIEDLDIHIVEWSLIC